MNGSTDICRLILEHLRDKNPYRKSYCSGITALHYAAERGHIAICRLIIEQEQVKIKNPGDSHAETPLYLAARWGHTDVCSLILKHVEDGMRMVLSALLIGRRIFSRFRLANTSQLRR